MSKPLLIGITGGIGAGKSLISKIFRVLQVPVYDADTRAKDLMVTSDNLRSAISVLFGEQSFDGDQLNRKHIADKAFHEPKLLSQLNELVHPAVQIDFEKWIDEQSSSYILKEAALLFETGSHKKLDHVILVTAPRETRIKRVLVRDTHRTEADVKAILSRQMSDEEKQTMADVVLKNDGTEMIIPKILEMHQQFSTIGNTPSHQSTP